MLGSQHSLYPGEHSLTSASHHCYAKHFALILASFTKIFVQCTICTIACMQPSFFYVVQSYMYMCVGIQPQLQLVSQYANLQSTNMTSDQSLMNCEFFVVRMYIY